MNRDDRERAVLASAVELLETNSLHELSVDDLARGAGISRSSFYFYFPSKEAVLLALLDSVTEEVDARRAAAFAALGPDSRDHWRAGITAFFETFREHRAIALAVAETRNSEVGIAWAQVMDGWIELVAALIDRERARGIAPPSSVPARDVAVALNLMNERTLQATFASDGPAIDESGVVDALVTIWLGAIYGPRNTIIGGSTRP